MLHCCGLRHTYTVGESSTLSTMTLRIQEHIPLAPYTTMRIGGPARYFCEPETTLEIAEAVAFARAHTLPWVVLGGGSNVVIADLGINGVVMRLRLCGIEQVFEEGEDVFIRAEAGESWDALVGAMVLRGLWGLENLSGIPGTVGAAPIQNINAYGSSVADTIESVEAYHPSHDALTTLAFDRCRFAYRDSMFKYEEGAEYIVTAVTFRLSRTRRAETSYRSASNAMTRYFDEAGITTPTLSDIRTAVLSIRQNIGMLEGCFQSAGSFFKNTILAAEQFKRVQEKIEREYPDIAERLRPWYWELPDGRVKVSTAFLMECTPYNKTAYAGKSFRNTVGISPRHSLSLINLGGATACDVRDFTEEIVCAITDTFGVVIELEVLFVGDR